MTKQFRKFIPITKIDVAQRLVYGLATCQRADRAGETCHYESTKPFYEAWSEGIQKASGDKSFGNVRAMHGKVAAGKLSSPVEFYDTAQEIAICAKIVDDAEWKKVEEGVYTGFSQGGRYVKTWKEGDINFYTADPHEVSLVDLPCLPESTFTAIKADGTEELRKFTSVIVEPSHTDVGNKATALAKAAGDETKWNEYTDEARLVLIDEQIEKAEKDPAEKPKEEAGDGKTKPDEKPSENSDRGKKKSKKSVEPEGPFWRCEHPEHRHVNKIEAVACMKKSAGESAATDTIAPLADALGKLREALDPTTPTLADQITKWFGDDAPTLRDEALALIKDLDEPAAILALDKRFGKKITSEIVKSELPETSLIEVKDNIVLIKNAPKTGDELAKIIEELQGKPLTRDVIAKIEGSAKALKIDCGTVWKTMRVNALRKGLYDICRLASLISELKWLTDSQIFEALVEGDGSLVPAALKASTIQLCQCLIAMVQEECAELFEDGEDLAILEMAAGSLSPSSAEALAKSGAKIEYIETLTKNASVFGLLDAVLDLTKAELGKAGARNSKDDASRIQKMHDISAELGAECAGPEKVASDDLSKDVENATLRKQLADMLPIVEQLTKDVKNLKAQPAPAKASTRLVGKTDDILADPAVKSVVEKMESMTPEQRTLELFKLSLASPIPGHPAHQG